jgi:hypothetical protein
MLKKIGVGFLVLLALIALAGLALPKSAHASRSTVIAAAPERVYPEIASLKEWNEWSAWNTRDDPKWKPTYSGPDSGAGAKSSWTESQSGAGTQTITAADPSTGVTYKIEVEGIGLVIDGKIAIAAEGAGTKVTWSDDFDFSRSYMMRYFGPMMGGATEKMIDKSFDGLRKRVTSSPPSTGGQR